MTKQELDELFKGKPTRRELAEIILEQIQMQESQNGGEPIEGKFPIKLPGKYSNKSVKTVLHLLGYRSTTKKPVKEFFISSMSNDKK